MVDSKVILLHANVRISTARRVVPTGILAAELLLILSDSIFLIQGNREILGEASATSRSAYEVI
jgi:hypothetical protein